jgi:hypothetical protein
MDMGLDQPAWFPNFSPMAALCLCVAACFPRKWAIVLPFVVLLGTDFLLNWHFSNVQLHATQAQLGQPAREFTFLSIELLAKTLAFVAIAAFGWQLRQQPRAKVLLPAAIGSSIFFYFVTNTAAWLSDPGYTGSFAGWAQALTTGLPQYPPTWQFYRNTFASDMLFTLLFLASIRVRPGLPEGKRQPVAAW